MDCIDGALRDLVGHGCIRVGWYAKPIDGPSNVHWHVALSRPSDTHPRLLIPTDVKSPAGHGLSADASEGIQRSVSLLLAALGVKVHLADDRKVEPAQAMAAIQMYGGMRAGEGCGVGN